jgi:hypothetical protein
MNFHTQWIGFIFFVEGDVCGWRCDRAKVRPVRRIDIDVSDATYQWSFMLDVKSANGDMLGQKCPLQPFLSHFAILTVMIVH